MQKLKRQSAITISVIAALTLVACQSGGSSAPSADQGGGSTEETTAATETVMPSGTLQIAHWDFLAPNYGEPMQEIYRSYEQYNPNATVETVGIIRADYETRIKIQLSAGGGPDIITLADTFLPEVAAAGKLVPLDGVFSEESQARLLPTNDGGVFRGEQLAIASQIAPYAFLWNQDILDAAGVTPPTTFDELLQAALTVEEKTGLTGFAVRHRFAEEVPWWVDFNNWIQGFGGAWSDGSQLTIDSAENVAAVTAFKEMYDSGAFAVGDDASTFRTKFSEGQVAMMIDATGAPPAMISEKVPATSMRSSKLPFPTPNTSQVGIYMGINSGSQNQELAIHFMDWFVSEDTQQAIFEIVGSTSGMATQTQASEQFLADNPWADGYLENATFTRSSVIPGFESVTPQIRKVVLSWIEKVLLEDLDPQEALSSAADQLR